MSFRIPDFSQRHLIVVGDVMLDRYWQGDVLRISPEAPVPVVSIQADATSPGGAANVAVCLATLGCRVSLYGLIGDDDAGCALLGHLSKKRIKSELIKHRHVDTITKLRVIDRSLHQQLIRLDFERSASDSQVVPDKEQLYQGYKSQIEQGKVDAVILSDYAKNTVLDDPQRFIKPARDLGIPVFVDPKRSDLDAYQGAMLLTPNTKEFKAAVGECVELSDFVDKGLSLMQAQNLEALLVTRGAEGMLLLELGKPPLTFEARSREVFDVTGAGDMVIALLAAGYTSGLTVAEAVELANLGAGLVVKKLGTASLSAAELEHALETQQKPFSKCLLPEPDLIEAVKEARARHQRIVFTNGCFDILHAGHITYLEQARALGDCLIVGVNDDDSITRLKGVGRPLNTLQDRLSMVAALRAVDWVVPFSEDTPLRLVKALAPDVLVKGGDYAIDEIVGADFVKSYGGTVKTLAHVKGLSTTALIKKLKNKAH